MKEKIVKATVKLISKDGINAATARNICELVGVTAPTLYHHYHDMETLLDAAISYVFDKHFEKITFSGRYQNSLKNIESVWVQYMEFARLEPDLYAVMMSSVAYGKHPKSAVSCFQNLVSSFEMLNESQKLKFSPRKSAMIYLGAAQGLALLIKNQPEFPLELSLATRKLILDGITISSETDFKKKMN